MELGKLWRATVQLEPKPFGQNKCIVVESKARQSTGERTWRAAPFQRLSANPEFMAPRRTILASEHEHLPYVSCIQTRTVKTKQASEAAVFMILEASIDSIAPSLIYHKRQSLPKWPNF